jgi:hypothetical protein
MLNRRHILVLVAAAVILPSSVYFGIMCPMPIDHQLNTELSPDGRLSGTYSWRPAGLIGLLLSNQPWLYLTIRNRDSGRIVARFSVWGDTNEKTEAEQRLSQFRPW